jgi:hypothetical protein
VHRRLIIPAGPSSPGNAARSQPPQRRVRVGSDMTDHERLAADLGLLGMLADPSRGPVASA